MPSTISQTNISNKTQTNICITHNYDNEQHVSVGLNKVIKLYPIPYNTHTHSHLTALCLGIPGWAGTRKVKPIWILLKQEIVSGSGISWDICKSAPHSRQISVAVASAGPYASLHCTPDRQPRQHPTTKAFYRPDALPAAQPTALLKANPIPYKQKKSNNPNKWHIQAKPIHISQTWFTASDHLSCC